MIRCNLGRPRGSCVGALLLFVFMLGTTPFCAAADPVWPAITDPPTSNYVPGKWVWQELFTEHAALAADFYGKVFGWTFQVLPAGRGPAYTLALSAAEPVAGMIERDHSYEQQRGSRWIGMISVPDVKAAARYAEKQGGKIIVAPRVLAGRGEVALLTDPEGTPFGIMRSSSGDPPDFLADENQWVWFELWAKDPGAMTRFYAGLAGYEIESMPRPDGRPGFALSSGGYLRCGIVSSPSPSVPSAWLPYVKVSDVKAATARAAQSGGRIVLQPSPEVREGRVSLITDPTGAPVGLVQLPAEETP
jgi:predicted enzyme related to lactoylglutathione lyase